MIEYKEVLEEILEDLRENDNHPDMMRKFFKQIYIEPQTLTDDNGELKGALRLVAHTINKGDLTFLAVAYEPMYDGAEPDDHIYKELVSWLIGDSLKDKFHEFTISHTQISKSEN